MTIHQPVPKFPDLPERVADRLRQDLRARYQPGDKLPPIRCLVSQFAVSINTMRAALSMLARDGLLELRHGSGTYVRQADNRPVGVLLELDFSSAVSSYFWRRLTQQVRVRLAEQGLASRLYAGFYEAGKPLEATTCPELVADLREHRLRGVVVTYGGCLDQWGGLARQQGVPVVGYGKNMSFDHFVSLDASTIVRQATRRLLAAGRTNLAYMDWGNPACDGAPRDDCFGAFAGALAERGLAVNPAWVRRDFHPTLPGAGWTEFREIWTGSREKPDGLVVTDDMLFRGVDRAIRDLGIHVPEQLRVTTHVNRGDSLHLSFPVDRIESDPDAFAVAQVELLLALLRSQPPAEPEVRLPMRFIGMEDAAPPVAVTNPDETSPLSRSES